MSQWNPAGFRSGNSVPWAIKDDTASNVLVHTPRYLCHLPALTIVIEIEENGE